MLIDGIFASEAIDSSGEILDVKGADISDFEDGKGVLNYEHRGDDAPGASANDIVGRIVFARKIFKETDCTSERERKYWKQIELPFIYGIIRLHDGAGHPGSVAAAAHFRDYAANKEEALGRFSIEGSTLTRGEGAESNRLLHTVCRRVAYTFKPCNKSADSGMIIDPNAPAGFSKGTTPKEADKLARLAEMSKKERQHPGYTRIGQGPEFSKYDILSEDEFSKATTAGSYNAAPGSLSGSAALQIEDAGLRKRRDLNQAKAAVRDWDGRGKFKPILKNLLPDADPDFIDKFGDMVDEYKLKKGEPRVQGPLTIRGRAVRPTPTVEKPFFDEKAGVLRTPRGSVPMYIPGRDPQPGAAQSFHNIMNDPATTKIHDYALQNWSRVRKHLRAGKLPDAVLMHATLFSQLSPNTPVPTQELMYAHLVDTMKQTGIDARDPRFVGIKDNWAGRDSPTQWPTTGTDHWQRQEGSLRLKRDTKPPKAGEPVRLSAPRKAGDIGSFMLANNKFENMSGYHKLHSKLADLVSRHRDNAQTAVHELMEHKSKADSWNNKRKRLEEKGLPDIGEYDGPVVRGLAPKTARYMYGMLGGGNVVVPDTHFIRHLFGLQKGKGGDGETHDYLQNVLWNERNSEILNGIDRYYGANHDAMQHMTQHPVAKNFDGTAQDLTFPAFWKHWMSIVPHEVARGMASAGSNEFTDHKPFWDTISEYVAGRVKKSDQGAYQKAMESVKEHLHWQETLGELPSLMMYYAFLVPSLLGDEEPRLDSGLDLTDLPNGGDINGDLVLKAEVYSISLSQKLADLQKTADWAKQIDALPSKNPDAPDAPAQPPVSFQGKKVIPGHMEAWSDINGTYHCSVLGHDAKHFYAVMKHPDQLKDWQPQEVQRINRAGLDRDYRMRRWPVYTDAGSKVDAQVHGDPVFNQSKEQHGLVHGLDMAAGLFENRGALSGITSHLNHWRRHPDGRELYIKGDSDAFGARPGNEAAYHNLARDVFGLGHYVPPVAVFEDPKTGARFSAIQKVKGKHITHSDADNELLAELHSSGDLHKLGIMDMLLGHSDRHDYNYMLTPDNPKAKMALIDNSDSLPANNDEQFFCPSYLKRHGADHTGRASMYPTVPVHDNAQDWAMTLDPQKLKTSLQSMNYPASTQKVLAERLNWVKTMIQDQRKKGVPLLVRDLFETGDDADPEDDIVAAMVREAP